ncbi:NAD(P)-binding protein [Karstenula rhodostoma CBS 690.94]|uniref:NAD(P)-binding protein n=1 Tax=Karstenula rhodostoma CBS 690.94 TaxID=1392251 RepID=A0A9P4UGU0_9PLEO|nr:NAD(P)-binding protein [Karstenula rhodostoma CBS 690.94]
MAPSTTKQWTVQGKDGFESLKWDEKAPVPSLGERDVLVKFHAASLNFRDLAIPKGRYPFPTREGVVPGSDGSGVVEAVGSNVTRFKISSLTSNPDKVATLFNQGHLAGSLSPASIGTGLGAIIDGALREYGAFDEQGLVHIPSNLDFAEASTLPCAALTAWNALYGLKPLKPGQTVLTQGTGGVSIFAIQFAKAAGARVIATTSSSEKADLLKKLGADHVINYKENPNWGEQAQSLSPGGLGVDHVVEVGGPTTLKQSLVAVKIDGVISIIGFIGGFSKDQPSFLDCLNNLCTVRGLLVGSRELFEEMNAAIEANDIHPIVDKKRFALPELKDAYEYMFDQKHFGKLVIKIAE